MNFYKITATAFLLLMYSETLHAQTDDEFGLDDVVIVQDKQAEDKLNSVPDAIVEEFAEEEIFTPVAEKEVENTVKNEDTVEEKVETEAQNLSAYVKALHLTDEQIDTIKYLNKEQMLRQEQLLRSVDLLKAQAKEIETQSLREFEAVLTPEQKEIFEQMMTKNIEQ